MKAMGLLTLAATLCAGSEPEHGTFPKEGTLVVIGRDVSAPFAAQELNTIVKQAAGYEFATNGVAEAAQRKIFIGRSSAAEQILGGEFLDSLQDEESVVLMKDGDLFLVGGGQLGALYAVYDFLEDHLNFRHYFKRDDGFVVDQVPEVVFKGVPTRRQPKFRGYRKDHHDHEPDALFEVRNRMNARNCERLVKGYRNPLSPRIPGHGFNPFLLPPSDRGDAGWGSWFKELAIKGEFEEHPEWFSLDPKGRRVPDAQLCLSNPGCREKLLENLIKWTSRFGPGLYMVGSNDNHNDRYCWCEPCVALEKKYQSVGGPLWDWILWACPELERRGQKGAIIASLAYKGWRQTEIAPVGIDRFPDNFNCDAAFLNADRELAYTFYDTKLPNGDVYDRLENLRKWCRLCKHVSYWYYGGNNPAQVWWRAQQEMRELYEAGVESVGFCGTGGGLEFNDFTGYICFKLLQDPYVDLEPDLRRIFTIKYGPAAGKVREYVDTLDAFRRQAIRTLPLTTGTDAMYTGFGYLDGRALLRLRAILDAALAQAKGTPYEQAVLEARMGLNVWTATYFHKIRAADSAAAAQIDCAALDAESRTAAVACLERRYPDERNPLHRTRRNLNPVLRALDEMSNYANLKSDALPPELAGEPRENVYRILPPKSMPYFCGGTPRGNTSEADPLAASGWAWMDTLAEKSDLSKDGMLHYEIYDGGARQWIVNFNQGRIPIASLKKESYTLVKLGRMRIPSTYCIILHGLWGYPTNITQPARLFDPSYQNKEWDVWMSIRAEGPKFFPGDDPKAPSRIWIDQLFCVDMGVPAGK